jgi:hypothetical protein
MTFKFYPKQIFKLNLYLIGLLFTANSLGIFSKYYLNHDSVFGLVSLFDFNTEMNIPSFYSSVALLISCVLLFLIAQINQKTNSPYYSWLGLSIIFLFLSIDEISSIHEGFGRHVKQLISTSGFLYYSWVIPYTIAVIIFFLVYIRFLLSLSLKIRTLFICSGGIFLTGAVGFEMLGGRQDQLYGATTFLYTIYYTIEELLEMFGIALFNFTLLTYLFDDDTPVNLTLIKH